MEVKHFYINKMEVESFIIFHKIIRRKAAKNFIFSKSVLFCKSLLQIFISLLFFSRLFLFSLFGSLLKMDLRCRKSSFNEITKTKTNKEGLKCQV